MGFVRCGAAATPTVNWYIGDWCWVCQRRGYISHISFCAESRMQKHRVDSLLSAEKPAGRKLCSSLGNLQS